MGKHYIRAFRADTQEDGGPLRFIAATEAVARDGMIIDSSGWRLDAYKSNPVVLWAHDYTGQRPPIGRAEVSVDEGTGNLMADVIFDSEDPFAKDVERKYRRGFLNAVSVGWNTIEMTPSGDGRSLGRVTQAELLDISAVPVPGDPGALMERQARGLADLGLALARLTDEPTETEEPLLAEDVDWAGTVALMARLYLNIDEDTEEERKKKWVRLARRYDRHGKQPPEYLSRTELSVLGWDEVRGLFLAGENDILVPWHSYVEERAGAVLSMKNKTDLETAVSLVRSVLERANVTDATEETPPAETPAPPSRNAETIAALTSLRSTIERIGWNV